MPFSKRISIFCLPEIRRGVKRLAEALQSLV